MAKIIAKDLLETKASKNHLQMYKNLFNYFNPLNLMLHSNDGYNLCEFNNLKG